MRQLFELVRRNWLFFLLATAAALALRLFFVFRFPHIQGDTFIYGDIAKNWLNHGLFGVTDDGAVRPTLIRLPGYPGFLAAMFAIFGQEHYHAVMIVQALLDANTCLVIAGIALEIMSARAAKAAYLLAAIYMRPDNGLVLPALGLALLLLLFRSSRRKQAMFAGAVLALASLGPLLPWTIRNWRVFHVWQPLASRYANDPGEFLPRGFNQWVRTWIVDFVSVEEVYWKVSGEPVDPGNLPERAFDSRAQYDQTLELISRYNQQLYMDPELDAAFDHLAMARENQNPIRYYFWLPVLRTADMWLRPRTEMLNIETRWWEFSEHEGETEFALAWAGLNAFFLAAALRGWWRWRLGIAGWLLIGFVILRSFFLSSIENPEPRYVLECFPVVLALAGGAFAKGGRPDPCETGKTNAYRGSMQSEASEKL
jgi:hypothetical protein